MNSKFLLSGLAAISCSLSAATVPYPNDYIYFSTGNVGFDTDPIEETSTQPNLGLGWGHNFSQHFAVEGLFRYSEGESRYTAPEFSLSSYSFGLSGLASTGPLFDTPFSLYGRASALYSITNLYNDGERLADEGGVLFNLGAGLQWTLGNNFWLKGEYIISVADSGMSDFFDGYDGVQISIGKNF